MPLFFSQIPASRLIQHQARPAKTPVKTDTQPQFGRLFPWKQQTVDDQVSLSQQAAPAPEPPETIYNPDRIKNPDLKAIASRIYQQDYQKALEAARKTPVRAVTETFAPQTIVLEIRNKLLKKDRIGIGLFVNDSEWVFQPDERIQTSTLLAHDISHHLLMNRDRTCNLPNNLGEYLAGSLNPRGSLFSHPAMYDSRIAGAADEIVSQETGDTAIETLVALLNSFRKISTQPDTILRLSFQWPPADIEFTEGKPYVKAYLPRHSSITYPLIPLSHGAVPNYTGYPYRPVQLESFEIVSKRKFKSSENAKTLQALAQNYQDRFNRQQRVIQGILEQGGFPWHVKLHPYSGSGNLKEFARKLQDCCQIMMAKGLLEKTGPETTAHLFDALFKDYQENLIYHPGGVKDYGDETRYVAPFPPPPYQGDTWRKAHNHTD